MRPHLVVIGFMLLLCGWVLGAITSPLIPDAAPRVVERDDTAIEEIRATLLRLEARPATPSVVHLSISGDGNALSYETSAEPWAPRGGQEPLNAPVLADGR